MTINLTSKAVLRFLADWQQAGEGQISRGNSIVIEFDPERLTGCRRRNWRGAELWNIEALARFHPRGEVVHDNLLDRIRTRGRATASVPKSLEFPVPSDARQLEIWFHNYDYAEAGGRCDAWDSRFGENYWFDVGGPPPIEPQDPVRCRDGAMARPDLVNVLDQSAFKRNVFPKPPNGGSLVGKDLRTSLSLRAWVKNIAYATEVWVDLHVFDRGTTRILATTFGLVWERSSGGVGDLFHFDGEIYSGLIATPGSVSPRPNAWLVQYRLYSAVEGKIYTDAILHQLELTDDAVA